MTSPFRRAPQRSSHLRLVNDDESLIAPHENEVFLLESDRTHKAAAVIDYTRRSLVGGGNRNYLIVPGYGGIKPAYSNFRDAMSTVDKSDATSYRHPRSEKGSHAIRPDRLLHPDRLGKQSVTAMIDVAFEASGGQKVTLVGHSMGGPNSVEGALRRKDKVAEVVLLGSGGLEEGQNIFRLGKRMKNIIKQEGKSILSMPRDNVISMFGQAAFHIARNPWRTFGEGIDIGNRDLMIKELNTLRVYGIGVHAVQLELDGFFPTEIAQRDSRGLVDTFTVIEGVDHVAPQVHPELVAKHIANVLGTSQTWFDMVAVPAEA